MSKRSDRYQFHFFRCGRGRITGVHLGLKGFVLRQSQVAGATLGGRTGIRRPSPRYGALVIQRCSNNVGGGVQAAFAVAAHQLAVAGEGYITLDDTGAHACPGAVGHVRMLRELQGGAPAGDGKIGTIKGAIPP